jgi:hypothetical protein
LSAATLRAQGREEFNGPFPSWADVKKLYGAKGDGQHDDSRALQEALDQLSNPVTKFNTGKGGYMVVYLPAGVYCLSSTLVLKGKIGVSIIGEDPANTMIKWIGGDKDTLFWANGSAYFKISRIGWDANGRKGMEGIGIHWKTMWNDGKSQSFAPLNIEISDCLFTDGFRYGISGGTYHSNGTGSNDSEIAIRRCRFQNCSESGIEIEGYNALDYWIWDCRFLHCAIGVNCAQGNYHLYRSFFSGSTVCDVHNDNGYYVSVRGCYSENAGAFSLDAGASSNPFKRIFQDNTIINPARLPVEYYHLGKITLWGNSFGKTIDPRFSFSINTSSWSAGIYEVMSLHNVYAYKNPIRIEPASRKLYAFGDQDSALVQPAAQFFLTGMDRLPPRARRRIFEVPVGSGADTIQAILNRAAALKGERPVVHFAAGNYYIEKPLEIPSGSDMQLIGDGMVYASSIMVRDPQVFGQRPVLLVNGPSTITIRELGIGSVSAMKTQTGIAFRNVDQPHAQAHLDQLYAQADTSLFVAGMNWLYVEKDNSFFSSGNYISGGSLTEHGKGTARVSCFGGQFARLTVKKNARFAAKDCWWEGAERVPLNLDGSGSVSIDGAMIAPANSDSLPTIRIGKFSGNISLMNMYVQGGLGVEPENPGLNLLLWNIHFYHKMNVSDLPGKGAGYKAAFLGLSAQCFRANDPACQNIICLADRFQNIQDTLSFLDTQTAQSRESEPLLPQTLAPGVSNIIISRVSLAGVKRGIDID